MNTRRIDPHLSPQQYAALFDAARRRAVQARREASDAFWSAVARAAASGWHVLHDAWRGALATRKHGTC